MQHLDNARTLTLNEMKTFNLMGGGPGYAEWMRAKAKTPQLTPSAPVPEGWEEVNRDAALRSAIR